MRHHKFNAEAEIEVLLRSRRQLDAIAAAMAPEASHPAGEKAEARIIAQRQVLKIKFRARDSAALRAIMSSYLRMLRATTNVCRSMLDLERGRLGQGID